MAQQNVPDEDHQFLMECLTLYRQLPSDSKLIVYSGLMIMAGQEARASERFGEEVVNQGRTWLAEIELLAAELAAPTTTN